MTAALGSGVHPGAPPGCARSRRSRKRRPEAERSNGRIAWLKGISAAVRWPRPLHAPKTTHQIPSPHRRAQRRSASGGFGWPRSLRQGAPSLASGREFRQHFVHEPSGHQQPHPRARRCLCGTDGSAHTVWPRCVDDGLHDGCLSPSRHRRSIHPRLQSLRQRSGWATLLPTRHLCFLYKISLVAAEYLRSRTFPSSCLSTQ